MPRRLLCLHGHFYQPPRENPWIEEIEVQDSAEPFHDWNERITAESYGPNGAARLKGHGDRITEIVNNYVHLSFNFGPTLLAWLERHRPDVYARVLEADALSLRARGHGNALAQGYNHAILPLCSPRDRRTQIRWGLEDFRRRFGREAEGFWLPETAADPATLADLAAQGIRFTILSPYQAVRVRPPGGDWLDATDARFDPTRPYRVRAGDRDLAVFFYDAHIARDLAFGGALTGPDALVQRLESGYVANRGHQEILTVAFDGETLGHHKKGGDEVLAGALRLLGEQEDVELVNLAQVLDRVPVEWEAEIVPGGSAWSCAHGLERWKSDCGCNVGAQAGWTQKWRAPLRDALDALRDQLAVVYEREGSSYLRDPWGARDRYVEVVLDPERRGRERFLRHEAGRPLSPVELVKASQLLEAQRQSLLMYTSCGWFFAEISGLETVQVLKYAARAIQLVRDATGADFEADFAARLAHAPSNLPELADGRAVYERHVKPSVVSLEGVGAHLAIASSVREMPEVGRLYCYRYRLHPRQRVRSAPATLIFGRLEVESCLTGKRLDASYTVFHLGSADFRCGLTPYTGPEKDAEVERAVVSRLDRLSLPRVLRELDRLFPGRDYAIRDLFLDERRRVAEVLLSETLRRYESHYREIFEDNRRLMELLRDIDSPIPGPLRVAADVTLTGKLLEVTGASLRGELDLDVAEAELTETVEVARRLAARLHLAKVRHNVEALVNDRVTALTSGSSAARRAVELCRILELAHRLGLDMDLWDAQSRVWAWASSSAVPLERELAGRLARALWFDEEALLLRAGYVAEQRERA
jgi:alpha-amylase/alpha-mannosidase (GH57 family)